MQVVIYYTRIATETNQMNISSPCNTSTCSYLFFKSFETLWNSSALFLKNTAISNQSHKIIVNTQASCLNH